MTKPTRYYIDRDIDGHPIVDRFAMKSLSKNEIVELLESQQWISVEDAQLVRGAVMLAAAEKEVDKAYLGPDNRFYYADDDKWFCGVTHVMPEPEPPETE